MVEFALVLPILAVVLFATMEFGRAYWTFQQLSAAASEGARRAVVSRTDPNRTTTVQDATRNAAPNLDGARMDVAVSGTWLPGTPVTVTADYPEKIEVLGVVLFEEDLVARRTMRVEQ